MKSFLEFLAYLWLGLISALLLPFILVFTTMFVVDRFSAKQIIITLVLLSIAAIVYLFKNRVDEDLEDL